MKALPSQAELLKQLEYEPDTGILRWRTTGIGRRKDRLVSAPTTKNWYLRVGIDYTRYYVHRIIWKMVTGEDPSEEIDHINGNRTDNRWENLRLADRVGNARNAKTRARSNKLPRGVRRQDDGKSRRCPYQAWVWVSDRNKYIGCYATPEEAGAAADAARRALHGEFHTER